MERAIWRPAAALLMVAAGAAAAEPAVEAGAYLQARQAAFESDYARASRHYATALLQDPSNAALMESTAAALLNAGEMAQALVVARAMERGGHTSQIGAMALLVERARTGEWDAALRAQEAGRSVGPLMDGLARGWALIGRGEGEAGLAAFAAVAADPELAGFGRLHEALARAALGDWAGAERLFAGRDASGAKVAEPLRLSRRLALARVEILSRLGRGDHALALLDHLFKDDPDPDVASRRARLAAGERLAYSGPRDARAGVAEAFFGVATALRGDAAEGYILLYARAAEALAPDHPGTALLTASLLEGMGRHDLALDRYAAVPEGHPTYPMARLGLASALGALGRDGEAIDTLRALAESHPWMPRVHMALGDALGASGRDGEAVAAYGRALAAQPDAARAPWALHYARALARERLGDGTGARADLARALRIRPDEPSVLHHLASLMLATGEPEAEALALFERALAASPDSGRMAGSVGWTLLRLGRVEEAVEHLERAAALEPLDAELNDRLGDALWSAGREREARFQWRRALTLDPAGAEAAWRRLKLARGLDDAAPGEGASAVTLLKDR